ncbi:MAG TPA: hypothetical protein VJN93_04560 [Candidatus Acidoferrum sp.]|nr:hypothetical protein [Candidatus Acidoferrum sp.]
MNATTHLPPKPEEEELRLKKLELENLQQTLIEKELYLANLRGELVAFEKLYIRKVGVLYAQLDEIEAQIAELTARQDPKNENILAAADQARRKAEDSKSTVGELALDVKKNFKPSPELKNLYREVARRIHPDLATDEADRARRQKLMAQANRAYEQGDKAGLRAILQEYEASPDTVLGEGTAAELVRAIRKIAQVRRRLSDIDRETNDIVASELFELRKKVTEGTLLGRDVLDEMASSINSQIAAHQAELRNTRERGKK